MIARNPRKCPIPGCKDRKRAEALLCSGHWQMLPRRLRKEIAAPGFTRGSRVALLREALRTTAEYESLQSRWHLRGFSIQQPWASAFLFGPKDVENRSKYFTVPSGGLWLAVHASAECDAEAKDQVRAHWPEMAPARTLPRSVVLGAVQITRWVPVDQVGESAWAVGPYCAVRGERIFLPKPMPCPGDLGLWKLPIHVLRALHDARFGPPTCARTPCFGCAACIPREPGRDESIDDVPTWAGGADA